MVTANLVPRRAVVGTPQAAPTVNEYTSPVLAEPATTGNLTDIIVLNATEVPQKVCFRKRSGDLRLDVTCSEFLAEVQGVAKGLIAAGCRPATGSA